MGARSGSEAPHRPDGADAQDQDPLLQLLRRMTEEHGTTKTANRLGVDRKTVWRALDAGRLTPRLRDALEREQVATQREAAGGDQLQLRVEGLERRLQEVEEQLTGGLTGLREELSGLREEVKTLTWARSNGAELGAGSALRSPHRNHPEVVTVEPFPDDEQVFGEATPLVAEWREQQARFDQHWPSVEGLEAEVRMLELELELIEQRRLTLPPGELPWDWDQRRRAGRQRTQRLGTARSNLRRARWRRRLLCVVGIGFLRT